MNYGFYTKNGEEINSNLLRTFITEGFIQYRDAFSNYFNIERSIGEEFVLKNANTNEVVDLFYDEGELYEAVEIIHDICSKI